MWLVTTQICSFIFWKVQFLDGQDLCLTAKTCCNYGIQWPVFTVAYWCTLRKQESTDKFNPCTLCLEPLPFYWTLSGYSSVCKKPFSHKNVSYTPLLSLWLIHTYLWGTIQGNSYCLEMLVFMFSIPVDLQPLCPEFRWAHQQIMAPNSWIWPDVDPANDLTLLQQEWVWKRVGSWRINLLRVGSDPTNHQSTSETHNYRQLRFEAGLKSTKNWVIP